MLASELEFLIKEALQQEITKILEPKRKKNSIGNLTLKPNGGVENIIAVYNEATEEEKNYWGKWYHHAKADVEALASEHNLSFPVVAAIVAVLSPGNRWNSNLVAADKLLKGETKINSYPRQVLKAKEILKTGDTKLVTGPKVTVFFASLMDPKRVEKDMVLDGHAINIWRGEAVRLKGLQNPTVVERAQMIKDYQLAAERLQVPVQSIQAVTWYIWKYTGKSAALEVPKAVYDVSHFLKAKPANDTSLDEVNAVGGGGIAGAGLGNAGTTSAKQKLWSGDEPLEESSMQEEDSNMTLADLYGKYNTPDDQS